MNGPQSELAREQPSSPLVCRPGTYDAPVGIGSGGRSRGRVLSRREAAGGFVTARDCSANDDDPRAVLSGHTLICFSHLRWDMVQQRPHHLMRRFARHLPIFYVEDPLWTAPPRRLEQRMTPSGVRVLTPCLPGDDWDTRPVEAVRALLDSWWAQARIGRPILWYYTPMALAIGGHFPAAATVYDCMDELTAFDFAPSDLADRERALIGRADLVFTGGRSLYE